MFMGLKYWNEQPNELHMLPNLESFEELLKHTYSVKHTIKTQTVNIYLFISSIKCTMYV